LKRARPRVKTRAGEPPSGGGAFGRSRALAGGLWLLLGVLVAPLGAQVPPAEIPPQAIHLRGGERQDLYLNLGADSRTDVELKARLVPAASWPDRERLRLAIVRNATEDLGTETVLQYVPGGRVLWLEAAADRCAPAGTYNASVVISAMERDGTMFGKTVRIPLNVEVDESWACGMGRAQGFLLTFPVAVCFFFVLTSVTHSRRLSIDRLAERFQLLKWDENGEPRLARDEVDVRGRIAEQLKPVERSKVWLAANPLLFGWRAYEETFEITLRGPSVFEGLQVMPVAPRLWETPPVGRLFARAKADGGIALLGVLDSKNRLAGLDLYGSGIDFDSGRELTLDLIYSASKRLRDRPAGWRLKRVKIRSNPTTSSSSPTKTRR